MGCKSFIFCPIQFDIRWANLGPVFALPMDTPKKKLTLTSFIHPCMPLNSVVTGEAYQMTQMTHCLTLYYYHTNQAVILESQLPMET